MLPPHHNQTLLLPGSHRPYGSRRLSSHHIRMMTHRRPRESKHLENLSVFVSVVSHHVTGHHVLAVREEVTEAAVCGFELRWTGAPRPAVVVAGAVVERVTGRAGRVVLTRM